MKSANAVAHIITVHYHLTAASMTRLRGHPDVLLGVYLVRDTAGRDFVARIGEPSQCEQFEATSTLLAWLHQNNYTAPQPFLTMANQLVAVSKTYIMQLVTYLPGASITRTARDLGLLATAVAKLHALSTTTGPQTISWWHPPTALTATAANLFHGRARVPEVYQSLIDQLLQVVHNLHDIESNAIIHGDSWYPNGVRVSPTQAALIDWDCAGIGPAILDLGALILTSHYDLTQPLDIEVIPARIQTILASYQSIRPLSSEEKKQLAASIPFYLAFNMGRSLAELAADKQLDLFQLQKCAARYNAVAAISTYAASYVDQ